MRKRSRRILGMTVAQILILLFLACVLMASLGGGAWMVAQTYGITFSGFPTSPALPTRPPANTLIPFQTFTPQPTATNTRPPTLTPTITPIPYMGYVPAGWKQYKTDKIEVWLPDTFAFVENVDAFNQEITDAYTPIGLSDRAEQLEKNAETYLMLFRQGPPLGSHYIPTVFVKEFPRNGLSLSQFNDKAISVLDINSTLVERKPFEFFERTGERVVIQTNFNSIYVNFVYYLLQDGDTIWEVGCDANLNDYYNFEPVFDDIAKTFRPVEK